MSKPLILKHDQVLKTELIRVGLSADYKVTSGQNRQEFQVKYDTVRHFVGSGLTLELVTNGDNEEPEPTGGIVIGDNINTVLVNLHVYFSDASKTGETKSLFIRRNAGGVNNKPGTMTSRVDFNRAQTTLETFAIIPVEKGDVITAGVVASQNDVIQATSTNNFFEIAKLN